MPAHERGNEEDDDIAVEVLQSDTHCITDDAGVEDHLWYNGGEGTEVDETTDEKAPAAEEIVAAEAEESVIYNTVCASLPFVDAEGHEHRSACDERTDDSARLVAKKIKKKDKKNSARVCVLDADHLRTTTRILLPQ